MFVNYMYVICLYAAITNRTWDTSYWTAISLRFSGIGSLSIKILESYWLRNSVCILMSILGLYFSLMSMLGLYCIFMSISGLYCILIILSQVNILITIMCKFCPDKTRIYDGTTPQQQLCSASTVLTVQYSSDVQHSSDVQFWTSTPPMKSATDALFQPQTTLPHPPPPKKKRKPRHLTLKCF